MAQPGISSHLKKSLQVGLLCAASVLGQHGVAHAANCVYTSSKLAASAIAPEGVLLIQTTCSGEGSECTMPPALEVERGGTRIQGSVELVYQARDALWVAFRPNTPWQEGAYTVHNLPNSWQPRDATFEVKASANRFVLDPTSVQLKLSPGIEPAGERTCCPSHGEGSCTLSCGGMQGERHVAVVRAVLPAAPESVVFRVVDAEAKDGAASFRGSFNFASSRDRYCVQVSAWNTVDDTTGSFERCLDGTAELGEVGQVDASWGAMKLEHCSAPPIVGGYGFDVWGEPDPDALPDADEALREAFCASKRETCGDRSQYAPDGGFSEQCEYSPSDCPCMFVLHYCPEFASEPTPTVPDAMDPGAEPDAACGDTDPSTADAEQAPSSVKAGDGCSLAHGTVAGSSLLWAACALVWATRRRA